ADLGWWDEIRGARVVEDAAHTVLVGRSATDIRLVGTLRVRAASAADAPSREATGAGRSR
ncbi:hypothetical protein QLR68_37250, partial [Micromonospora sp. DH15]|nr:hypothetical protein [Micromonospora sp. DH15]